MTAESERILPHTVGKPIEAADGRINALLNRRVFLQQGSLILAAAAVNRSTLQAELAQPTARFGLVTDLHYADKPAAGTRHYRETLTKLDAAAEEFRSAKLDFLVELGDFIDAAPSVKQELGYLQRINREFAAICKHRHYVLGNHCVHTLRKPEFLDAVEKPQSFYSFDSHNLHFVILDSCFRSDGQPYGRQNFQWTDPNLPAEELEWLRTDLQENDRPTILFAHQRLDVGHPYGVKNAAQVRKILEQSGRVLAVFQGHSHKNDHKLISGIHYCTLVAMVEGSGAASNGFSTVSVTAEGHIQLDGFLKQADYEWMAVRR